MAFSMAVCHLTGCENTLARISPKFITSISKAMPEQLLNDDAQEGGNIFDDQIRVGVGIKFLCQESRSELRLILQRSGSTRLMTISNPAISRKYLTRFGKYIERTDETGCCRCPIQTWLTEGLQASNLKRSFLWEVKKPSQQDALQALM